jgi:hypothetical protein
MRKLEELEREQTIVEVDRMLSKLPVQAKGTVSRLVREARDAH